MVTAHSIVQGGRAVHALLLVMSDWGFAIVSISFLHIYIGFLFSGEINPSPLFIGGLFILAFFSGIAKKNRLVIPAFKK